MTLTVLAVDDSRAMRDLISHALISAGFDTHMAVDGEHGLDLLRSLDPDAIITDLNMPKMDGFDFIAEVRRKDRHRKTPILVLTTEHDPDLKRRARDAGATGWIVKPFEERKLIRALQMVSG